MSSGPLRPRARSRADQRPGREPPLDLITDAGQALVLGDVVIGGIVISGRCRVRHRDRDCTGLVLAGRVVVEGQRGMRQRLTRAADEDLLTPDVDWPGLAARE